MRGILLAIVVGGSLPYCFLEPRLGILIWLWLGLMNPQLYAWGPLTLVPFALLVAIATIAGTFIGGKAKTLPAQKEVFLVLILWLIFTLTTLTALEPEYAWIKWKEVTKILVMVFLSMCLDWDRQWIKYMTAVIAFSIGVLGIKGAEFSLRTGGQYQVMGPNNSFLEANTAIAIALVMTLPLFLILARDEKSGRRFKILCYVALAASALSALLTYSRGGLLGLVVAAGLLLIKSRYKLLAAPLAAVAVAFALWFLPQQWFGRMATIERHEEEPSATSRIVTWKVLWQFALDHPVMGGGFLLYSPKVSERYLYKALPPHEARKWEGIGASAHSIWFAVLAEHGFIALFLYIMLFISTFMSLRWLKLAARNHTSLGWMESYGSLLGVSFWAFAVAGSFLDFAYFDLFFQFIGIVVILKSVARKELAVTMAERRIPARYPVLSPLGVLAQK